MKKGLVFLFFIVWSFVCFSQNVYWVTNNSSSGQGSLLQAIIDAEADNVLSHINFNLPSDQLIIDYRLVDYPQLTNQYILDGTTQNNYPVQKPVLMGFTPGTIANNGTYTIKGLIISSNYTRDHNKVMTSAFSSSDNIIFYSNCFLEDCEFYSVRVQIDGIHSGNTFINNCTVRNCTFGSPTSISDFNYQTGLTAQYASNITFSNNKIYGAMGVYYASNVKIIANKIYSGQLASGYQNDSDQGAYQGLYMLESSNVTVGKIDSGNVVTGSRNYTLNQSKDRYYGSGIMMKTCDNVSFKANIIGLNELGTDTLYTRNGSHGIYMQECSNIVIGGILAGERNIISGNKAAGIHFYSTPNLLIQNNYIGTDISGTKSIGNDFCAIYGEAGSDNPVIQGNLISGNGYGIDSSNFDSYKATNDGQIYGGITLFSLNNATIKNNTIKNNATYGLALHGGSSSNLIKTNDFSDNGINGVFVYRGSTKNKISQSTFRHAQSINTDQFGNNAIQKPYGLSCTINLLTGKAAPNDSIEIFLSDGKAQNTVQYLGVVVAKGDSVWSYRLPDAIFTDSSIAYLITSATDVNGNTSELSSMLKVNFCPTCPCEVTTTADNGDNNNPTPGSLRAAILCANAKASQAEIKFKLTGTAPFTFTPNGFPPILNPYGVIIDGNSQAGSAAVNEKKIIIKTASLFLPQTGPSQISNIEFQNQVYGVMSFSDSLTVSGCKFINNTNSVYVQSSGSNFTVNNNSFEGGSVSVSFSNAKNVLVDNNQYLNVANAINFQTVDSSTISNNSIDGITGTGINLSSFSKNVAVQNTNIVNATSNVYGVLMQSSENIFINKYKQIGGKAGVTYSGKNIAVKNSYFKNVKVGIAYGTQSSVLSFQNDTIINSETGIFISNYATQAKDVLIENCVIDSCSISGIEIASNQGGLTNGIIQNNKITRFLNDGINIGQGDNNIYQYNEIGNGIGAAFKWPRGNSNTKINNNFIGVDKLGVSMPIQGIGIDISSQTNQGVGTSGMIRGNIICNIDSIKNTVGAFSGSGIVLGSGIQGISILNNSIGINSLYQDMLVKKPLYLFYSSLDQVKISQNKLVAFSGQKPIDLNGVANKNKPSPKTLASAFQANVYSFKGKAYPGDTIEVFISNALVSAATSYVAQGIALADSTFAITLPDSILNKGDFYVAATARDVIGNTSELSAALKIYCQACLCEVTTTADNGDNNNPTPGSLRAAILCANAKASQAEIKFKLAGAGPYVFNPSVAYSPIVNVYGVTIDGNSQTKTTVADTIVINGTLFLPKVGPSKIANLSFGGVSGGLTCYSDSIAISDCHFSQGNGLYLKLDNSQRIKQSSRLAVTQASVITISKTTFDNTIITLNNINGANITSNVFINGNTTLNIDNQSENIVISKNTFINLASTALLLYSKSTVIDGNKIIFNDITQTGIVAGTCGTDVTISNHYQKGGSIGITYNAYLTLTNSKFVNIHDDVLFSANTCGSLTMAFDTIVNTKRGAALDNIQKIENCIFDSISVLAIGRSQFAKLGAVIQNNTFTRIVGDAIYLHRPQFDTIQNNLVEAVLNSASTSHHGIYVLSPGFSGNNVRIFKNKFYNFDSGIDFNGESHNTFSQNLFNNIHTKAIVLEPIRTNNLKPAPDSLSFTYNSNYLFNGKSYPGDTIEVFLSNYAGTDATSYVAKGITLSDGTFSIVIPDSVLAKELFFLAATATDVLGNTSELSAPLKICITCACVVENTNPTGDGSLLEAINCANRKDTRTKITFAIPGAGPYVINQTSPLPAFNNPLGIVVDGLSQDTAAVGTGNQIITIANANITLNAGENSIANLHVTKGDLIVQSSNNQFNQLTFKKAPRGISVEKNGNTIVQNNQFANCYVDSTSYGISSDGINTVATNCVFSNGEYGIYLNSNNANFIFKNSQINSSSNGIYSFNDKGGNVADSITIANANYGVYLKDSPANTFSHLTISPSVSPQRGLHLMGSANFILAGSTITGFTEGIWLQGCDNSVLEKNTILGKSISNGTGIVVRSSNTIVASNTIENTKEGIMFFAASLNTVKYNTIGNVQTAINDFGSDNLIANNYLGLDSLGNKYPISNEAIKVGMNSCIYKDNVIGNANTAFLLQGYVSNATIDGNYIGVSKNGTANTITGVAIKSVHAGAPFTNSLIQNNIINNVDTAMSLYTSTLGIDSKNHINYNQIGDQVNAGIVLNGYSNTDLLTNTFDGIGTDAIQLLNGAGIKLSKNTVSNPGAKAININLGLATKANLEKTAPTIIYSKVNATNWSLTGKSSPGDTIEIFKGAVNPQVASKYIGYAIAGLDSMWTATLALAELDQSQKSYFVGTASDVLNNTSELSAPYGFCESCVCLVENTTDAAPKSLREAILKSNNGDCNQIKFNITPLAASYKIVLATELPTLIRNVKIDGSTQTGYEVTKIPVIQLSPQTPGAFNGLTSNYYNTSITGLYFNGFKTGAVLKGEQSAITASVFGNSKEVQVKIDGKNNTLSYSLVGITPEGLVVGTDASGVQVDGKNNTIISNTIAQNGTDGVVVTTGIGHQILNNTITDNGHFVNWDGKAIHLLNASNNNKLAPVFTDFTISGATSTINGTAKAGDIIQVFTNSNLAEQALVFVGETIADGSGKWTMSIASPYFDDKVNNYYVATATELGVGTSPLGNPFMVGTLPVTCYVKNTKDAGPLSLRAAIGCANSAGTQAKIVYELPGTGTQQITLLTALPTWTNMKGITMDATGLDIVLKANNDTTLFNLVGDNNAIAAINFARGGVVIRSTNNVIDNNYFSPTTMNDATFGVSLKGNSANNVIVNNTFSNLGKGIVTLPGFTYTTLWIANNKLGFDLLGANTTLKNAGLDLNEIAFATIQDNTIGNITQGDAIKINTASNSILLLRNKIGINASNQKATVVGAGITISNASLATVQANQNTIYNTTNGIIATVLNNASITKNTFDNNSADAINIASGDHNLISQNLILSQPNAAKAININGIANANKSKPRLAKYTVRFGKLILTGKSAPGNIVEVFNAKPLVAQTATNFIATYTAGADSTFTAEIALTSLVDNAINYLTATARDNSNNTSELCNSFSVNLTVCKVKSTLDDGGEFTLRNAFVKANKEECKLVLFELSSGDGITNGRDVIEIQSALPLVYSPYVIVDGTSETNYNQATGPEVVVKNVSGNSLDGLRFSGANVSVNALEVANFDTSVTILKTSRETILYANQTTDPVILGVNVKGSKAELSYNLGLNTLTTKTDAYKISGDSTLIQFGYVKGFVGNAYLITGKANFAYGNNAIHCSENDTLSAAAFNIVGDKNTIMSNTATVCGIGFKVTSPATQNYLEKNTVKFEGANLTKANSSIGFLFDNVSNNTIRQASVLSAKVAAFKSISTSNSNYNTIKSSTSDSSFVGVKANGGKLFISENTFRVSHYGAILQDMAHVKLNKNYFSYGISTAIFLSNSSNDTLIENTINNNKGDAIQLESANNLLITDNTIASNSNGIVMNNCDNNQLLSNNIGTDKFAKTYGWNQKGIGVYLKNTSNCIIGNVGVENHIGFNALGGVKVENGNNNAIIYNTFISNSDSVGQEILPPGIGVLNSNGNNLINAPFIIGYQYLPGNMVKISGKANALNTAHDEGNAVVHLYKNAGGYQDALTFMAISTTNADGTWEAVFPKSMLYQKDSTTYLISTFTGKGNTSEFSNIIPIGICYVNSVKDNGSNKYPYPGSYRQGVTCVNQVNEPIAEMKAAIKNTYPEIKIVKTSVLAYHNQYDAPISVKVGFKQFINLGHNVYDTIVQKLILTDSTKLLMSEGARFSDTLASIDFSNITLNGFNKGIVSGGEQVNIDSVIVQSTRKPAIGAAISLRGKTRFISVKNAIIDNYFAGMVDSCATRKDTALFENNHLTRINNAAVALNKFDKLVSISQDTISGNFGNGIALSDIKAPIVISKNKISSIDTTHAVAKNYTGISINKATYVSVIENNNLSYTAKKLFPTSKMIDVALGLGKIVVNNNVMTGDSMVSDAIVINIDSPNTNNRCVIRNNKVSDFAQTGLTLKYTSAGTILQNQFNEADTIVGNNFNENQKNDLYLVNARVAYIANNNLGSTKVEAIKLETSNYVKMTKNLLSGQAALARGIDISKYVDVALVSNEGKQEPIINKFYKDKDAITHRKYIYIQGKAKKGDVLEFYLGYNYSPNMNKFIDTLTVKKADGSWDLKVPTNLYATLEDTSAKYLMCTATENHNTSELSPRFRLPYVYDTLIVTNTLNATSNSLRYVIEELNNSEIFSLVHFKIENEQPIADRYTIPLDTELPAIINPRGVYIDTYTQWKVLPKTSVWVTKTNAAVITGLDINATPKSVNIKGLNFNDISIPFRIANGNKVKFNNIKLENGKLGLFTVSDSVKSFIVDTMMVSGFDTAMYIVKSEKVDLISLDIHSGKTGLIFSDSIAKINITKSDFNDLSKNAINIEKSPLSEIKIEGNRFGTGLNGLEGIKGRAISMETSSGVVIKNNAIGNVAGDASIALTNKTKDIAILGNTIGVAVSGKAVTSKPITGNAIKLEGATGFEIRGVNILDNKIGATGADAILLNYAFNNTIVNNTIGYDTVGAVAPVAGAAISMVSTELTNVQNNKLVGFGTTGCYVESSTEAYISKNIIFTDKATSTKGILYNAPIIDAPAINTAIMVLDTNNVRVTGTAGKSNMKLEIFVGYKGQQNSLKYIGDTVSLSDKSWSFTLPKSMISFGEEMYYIATATDDGVGTSEFSNSISVKGLLCSLSDFLANKQDSLCPEISKNLGVTIKGIKYNWSNYKTGEALGTDQYYKANKTGTYKLTLSDDFGCSIWDTNNVLVLPEALKPDFIVANELYSRDTIKIVDLSAQTITHLSWHINDSLEIKDPVIWLDPEDKTNKTWFYVFQDAGNYKLTMKSTLNTCASYTNRDVVVKQGPGPIDKSNAVTKALDLVKMVAQPVPALDGALSLDLEFNRKSDVMLYVFSMTNVVMYTETLENFDTGLVSMDKAIHGLPSGIYFIKVISEDVEKTLKVVIINQQ